MNTAEIIAAGQRAGSAGRDAGLGAGEIQGYHHLHGYRRYGAERGRRRRRRELHHQTGR